MDSDLPLLERVRTGDERALEELMLHHQEALYYFVLRYLGNEHSARDVVQETFVRVYFKAASFQPQSSVKTWLYTIALNLCRDVGRRSKRAPAFISLDELTPHGEAPRDILSNEATADEAAADHEAVAHLRVAITRLPENLRAPLVLCTLEQRSHQEAAEILQTTPKSIELRIYRAKRKLRSLLERMHVLPG